MAKQTRAIPALRSLKPFRSFLFLKVSGGNDSARAVSRLRNGLAELASDLSGAQAPLNSTRSSREGDLTTAFAVYFRERRAPWTTDPAFIDREHHLIVVSGYEHWLAVFMSDAGLRETVKSELSDAETDTFDGLEVVSSAKLNAVFVKGRAKTLWLNNVQRRTSLKADHKVLSGMSLQDALDPLGDQSYAFTAARCQNDLAGKRSSYGVAPRKSRVWFKPSKNWDEYRNTAQAFLRLLHESTLEEHAPLPVLSAALDGPVDLASLGTAYEVSLLPPELLNPAEEAELDAREVDATPDLSFDVVDGKAPTLVVDVSSRDGAPSRYSMTIAIAESGRVSWAIGPGPAAAADPEGLAVLKRYSGQLNVSFDGGYSVSDGMVHRVRYRDLPFNGFKWVDFGTSNIRKEKPVPMNATTIGTLDSLFCWLKSEWAAGRLDWLPQQGWLACNDSPTEIADFIHLDKATPASLTLIHVKAAKSSAGNRGLAVAPYEVVVGQAIKNLRHVDPQLAVEEFTRRLGKQISDAVWQDGVAARREDMLAAIRAHRANLARRVIVVQPQTRRQAQQQALQRPEGSKERHLVRQLHGLLLGAQRDCSGVGAELLVVGQDA